MAQRYVGHMGSLFSTTIKEPKNLRHFCRTNQFEHLTNGFCPGYQQANLIIIPKQYAYDFLLYCNRNKSLFTLIEATDIGSFEPYSAAFNADLRTDLPKYKLMDLGMFVADMDNISEVWEEDFVSFLISDTSNFDYVLRMHDVPIRYAEENLQPPIYQTTLQSSLTNDFFSPIMVQMYPMMKETMIKAIELAEKYPNQFVKPIHFGNSHDIGIKDLKDPLHGDYLPIHEGEIPVFWPSPYTAVTALINSKIKTAIVNDRGFCFVTDIKI